MRPRECSAVLRASDHAADASASTSGEHAQQSSEVGRGEFKRLGIRSAKF